MKRKLLFIGLLLTALASADPLTLTFSGTGSGSVGGNAFDSAAFIFTFDTDTNLITKPSCCQPDSTTPNGTPATFWIDGIGSGTLMGDQAVFVNPSPAELNVGIWHYNEPDWLVLNSSAFATYDFSTNLGPLLAPLAYAFTTPFPTSLGMLHLDSVTGVTFTSVVGSPTTGASVPEPSSVVLLGAGLALVCGRLRRRKINSLPVGNLSE